MKVARFDFDPALQPLLARGARGGPLEVRFQGRQSAKHLIESLGIPHTEVGELTAGGRPADLGTIVQGGDSIAVHPAGPERGEGSEPRFVLDCHLGRLASRLRALGLDCLYRRDYDDEQLVLVSLEQERALLTRDRRLLMRKAVTRGCLVRSLEAGQQMRQVAERYDLARWIAPFKRCPRCNQPLVAVSKETVLGQLEPLTKEYYHEFKRCPGCGQVYWKGSHVDHMLGWVAEVAGSA